MQYGLFVLIVEFVSCLFFYHFALKMIRSTYLWVYWEKKKYAKLIICDDFASGILNDESNFMNCKFKLIHLLLFLVFLWHFRKVIRFNVFWNIKQDLVFYARFILATKWFFLLQYYYYNVLIIIWFTNSY